MKSAHAKATTDGKLKPKKLPSVTEDNAAKKYVSIVISRCLRCWLELKLILGIITQKLKQVHPCRALKL